MIPTWLYDRLVSIEKVEHCGQFVENTPDSKSIGLGGIYYYLARTLKPKRILVIGSLRGFSPICFARALKENNEGGKVVFIDPGLIDDHWHDPKQVTAYFESFGVSAIVDHHKMKFEEYESNVRFDLVLIDGKHDAKSVEHDFNKGYKLLINHQDNPDRCILLHDSTREDVSPMYPEPYQVAVKKFLNRIRFENFFDVINLVSTLPGLAMVKPKGS